MDVHFQSVGQPVGVAVWIARQGAMEILPGVGKTIGIGVVIAVGRERGEGMLKFPGVRHVVAIGIGQQWRGPMGVDLQPVVQPIPVGVGPQWMREVRQHLVPIR